MGQRIYLFVLSQSTRQVGGHLVNAQVLIGSDRSVASEQVGVALLDFLDAERTYRATQLAYRQAVAGYLSSLEQLRQAVGTRNLL